MSLTELAVRKLVKKSKRYEIHDRGGLYVRVSPSGTKTWIFRYQFDNRPRRMTLGKWPGIGIAMAREKHAQALQEIQRGNDPGQKAIERKAKHKIAPTVSDLLEEFWAIELGPTPSGKERRRLIEKDIIPHWGKRKVYDITRRDAVLLLDRVRKRAPVGANRLQGALTRMFNFAAERGIIDFSPLIGMRRIKEMPRSRVLADEELRMLWVGLDLENLKIDLYPTVKLALKMILVTGQRPGEVSDMHWSDLDGDFWTIPADRSKNHMENRVPLGQLAMSVIKSARTYSSLNSEFVFESPRRPCKQINRASLGRAVLRHYNELGIKERFTPHDLRRTVRTRLAGLAVSDHIAERVLGHKLQGVMAVYNQYSYDQEKRQALSRWESELSSIINIDGTKSNNVIELSERRGA